MKVKRIPVTKVDSSKWKWDQGKQRRKEEIEETQRQVIIGHSKENFPRTNASSGLVKINGSNGR
jgi:hypothetical protein